MSTRTDLLIPEDLHITDNEILTQVVSDIQTWARRNSQQLHDRAQMLEVALRFVKWDARRPMLLGLDQRAAAWRVSREMHAMGAAALAIGGRATSLLGQFNGLFLEEPEPRQRPEHAFTIKQLA